MWTLPQGKNGDLVTKPPFAPWGIPIYRGNDVKEIELTQGKVTLVDDDMYEYLNQWNWHVLNAPNNRCYAIRNIRNNNGKWRTLGMHRVIMNAQVGQQVDHKDRNGLHNWRGNLRFCTSMQNQANRGKGTGYSSQFKGVTWDKRGGKWQPQIMVHGKHIYLGYFDDEADAARAYNDAAIEHFSEFARLNVIEEA